MILAVVITSLAQMIVSGSYSKYRKERTTRKITGAEVARLILDKNGLSNVKVVETKGQLTDHYDPRSKVVRLSSDIHDGSSIASVAVAAHEVGHAIQDKTGYLMMKIRSAIVPIVNIGTTLGYVAIMIGFIFSSPNIAWIGIILECSILLFQLVTLPVEFDASRRAKKELASLNILEGYEARGAASMLRAAAFTYVAGLISTLLQILRLVVMVAGNNRD